MYRSLVFSNICTPGLTTRSTGQVMERPVLTGVRDLH